MKTVRLVGPKQRAFARQLIGEAPDEWVMVLREPTRTIDQNALLWPLLTDLSEQMMWPVNGTPQKLSPDDWKDIATAALTKEQRVTEGMDGGFVFIGRSTRTMSKRKFSDLIEIIHEFGARHGVVFSQRGDAA